MSYTNRTRQFISNRASDLSNVVGRADDAIQASVRDHILRLPTDGSRLPQEARQSALRNVLGGTLFRARPGYSADGTFYKGQRGDAHDYVNLLGSRALQAGAVTAAGYSLLQLAQAMAQHGSPADYQDPYQLSL